MYVGEREFLICLWMREGSYFVCGRERVPLMYVEEGEFLRCMCVREGSLLVCG